MTEPDSGDVNQPGLTAKMREELGLAMIQMNEMFEPIMDNALGQRRKLEADGWSPTAAETIALTQVLGLMNLAFSNGANNQPKE